MTLQTAKKHVLTAKRVSEFARKNNLIDRGIIMAVEKCRQKLSPEDLEKFNKWLEDK